MSINSVTCPMCGVEEPFDADGQAPPPLHQVALFTCEACQARVVYGTVLPRIVVEPYCDTNGFTWVRKRYQDPRTREDKHVIDLDPKLAAMEAKAVLALVIR